MTSKIADIAERTAVTAVEAALAYLATRVVDISPVWAAPVAAVLAFAKSWIATHFGNGSASVVE